MTRAPATPSASSASPSASEPARLDALPLGAEATLGPPDACTPTVLRLVEMGMREGERVRLLRRAPLGDPLEVHLASGPRLCLRRADAHRFLVREVTP